MDPQDSEPKTPTVAQWMTSQPVTIGREQTLSAAHQLMREHGVRHLPVVDQGALVGVVSLRELLLVEALGSAPGDAVDDVAIEEACRVSPDDSIAAVAGRMVARKVGCAVVVEGGRVVGVFTSLDALRLLSGERPAIRP